MGEVTLDGVLGVGVRELLGEPVKSRRADKSKTANVWGCKQGSGTS